MRFSLSKSRPKPQRRVLQAPQGQGLALQDTILVFYGSFCVCLLGTVRFTSSKDQQFPKRSFSCVKDTKILNLPVTPLRNGLIYWIQRAKCSVTVPQSACHVTVDADSSEDDSMSRNVCIIPKAGSVAVRPPTPDFLVRFKCFFNSLHLLYDYLHVKQRGPNDFCDETRAQERLCFVLVISPINTQFQLKMLELSNPEDAYCQVSLLTVLL